MTTKPPSDFMRKSLAEAMGRYVSQMPGSRAEAYLAERGLSNETQEFFQIGVVANPLPEHQNYKGRLAIPYITPSGIVAMRFRIVPPDESDRKYLGIAGVSAKKLFNTRDLMNTERVFICEGEIDAMTAHQVGLKAVGVAGVSNWNNDWWRIFRNRRVTVLADNDDKGQGKNFAEEICQSLSDCDTIVMPTGHDVNSLVMKHGPDALLQLIQKHDERNHHE